MFFSMRNGSLPCIEASQVSPRSVYSRLRPVPQRCQLTLPYPAEP